MHTANYTRGSRAICEDWRGKRGQWVSFLICEQYEVWLLLKLDEFKHFLSDESYQKIGHIEATRLSKKSQSSISSNSICTCTSIHQASIFSCTQNTFSPFAFPPNNKKQLQTLEIKSSFTTRIFRTRKSRLVGKKGWKNAVNGTKINSIEWEKWKISSSGWPTFEAFYFQHHGVRLKDLHFYYEKCTLERPKFRYKRDSLHQGRLGLSGTNPFMDSKFVLRGNSPFPITL